jgi:hypothetical protein
VTVGLPVARALLAQVRARREALRRDPSRAYQWLPNQHSFLTSSARVCLIRQGNQWGGKTTAALYEVLCHLRGEHPFKEVPAGPVEWWVMCAETTQSIAIQRKLWDLLNPDEVADGCEFDDVRGFRGRSPVLQLKNGSICRFKTTGQRTITLAGATLDGVLFDEPPTSLRLYTEVSKRVMNRGGRVLLAMTPINAGPMDWLMDLVEQGAIEDHHARLTADALIPVGADEPIRLADGTLCNAAWVERVIAETPEYERDVVCHGEWEFRAVDRVFTAFTEGMVTDALPAAGYELRIGIDYGSKVGKQYAVLMAVVPGLTDEIWVIDETPQSEHSTIDDDAREVLAMLERNGLGWTDLAEARGDRQYERGATYKGNRELHTAIARRLNMAARALHPRISTAKRIKDTGRRSVDSGIRYLHRAMVSGRYHVHPCCVRHIEALQKWDGRQHQSRHTGAGLFTDSYDKDPIDAVRYGLESRIFARGSERAPIVRFT